MVDSCTDTLTTIEAKVLRQRYGIGNLDERDSLRVLRLSHGGNIEPIKSVEEVATILETDTELISETEQNAISKLKYAE